ncbi:MAG: hypothetical protein A2033_02200 [Bacteroidetes bacterium GWA2_31_9]|nr:MAG: hypothetical protein A2033_02200 [Bacteroidetes bacterium GWA2_31_9]
MTKKTISTLIVVSIFSIAMGFMESAVVIYLREMYYPEGFAFPIKIIEGVVATTEIFREIATIIMLSCIGFIAGKTFIQRFAYFIFSFAIWDIFYYVFLKALIGWPESLFTWDLLFLLPVAWVSPVLAPILCTIAMIWLALLIIIYDGKGYKIMFQSSDWILLIIGSLVIMISFTTDHLLFMNKYVSITDTLKKVISQYIPQSFNWSVFLIGYGIILFVIIRFWYRIKNINYEK